MEEIEEHARQMKVEETLRARVKAEEVEVDLPTVISNAVFERDDHSFLFHITVQKSSEEHWVAPRVFTTVKSALEYLIGCAAETYRNTLKEAEGTIWGSGIVANAQEKLELLTDSNEGTMTRAIEAVRTIGDHNTYEYDIIVTDIMSSKVININLCDSDGDGSWTRFKRLIAVTLRAGFCDDPTDPLSNWEVFVG